MPKKELIVTRRQTNKPKAELKITLRRKVEDADVPAAAAALQPAPPSQPEPGPTVSHILRQGMSATEREREIVARPIKLLQRKTVVRAAVKVIKKPMVGGNSYQELLQSIYDGVLITDMDGRILEVNHRAREFTGYTARELASLSVPNVICGADEGLLETLRHNVDDRRYTLLEAFCQRKDKTRFQAEIAINLIHLSKRGELCFLVRDITVRKRTEEMLRTEHNAIQNAANGIVVADTRGVLQFANPAFLRMWGFGDEENLREHSLEELLRDKAQTTAILESLAQDTMWVGEAVARRRDGSMFYVQASVAPNRDDDGESIGMVFSFVDVTDRRAAEEALRKANDDLMKAEKVKARLDTITTLSHEINNPLQMLLSMVELESNDRYKAPVDRIIAVLRELRKQEDLPTVSYAGGLERYQLSEKELLTPCNTARLLIADDEPDLRTMFGEFIGSAMPELRIDYAADGQEAVDLFTEGHHAVIVLDIVMPTMNGEQAFEAIAGICRQKQWKMPAVIFCTAFVPPEVVKKTVDEDERSCYVPKPIGRRELLDAVRRAL